MPEGRPEFRHIRRDYAVPANTAQASPQVTAEDLGQLVLESVQVIVPTGHAGLTGWQLVWQGRTLVPWGETDRFVVADGVPLDFPVDVVITAPLQVRAFNTDEVFAHTFYVSYRVRDLAPVATADVLAPGELVPIA